ncbi:glycoside hydrolase [Jaminaea rosea]|uniref:beta-glucosidase n=1 Tax=Jaminaea rosea TaxID=1569628 RepID=A0A316V0T9_9BASI|nr:glycoside hydrolase [Jaminaea rosea]PWN31092.1 glycoside hydrolase [Jaminaea rosea]
MLASISRPLSLAAAAVTLCTSASANSHVFPPVDTSEWAFSDHYLWARQSQGIGGDGTDQPPGVPFLPDIPFAMNDSFPYSPPFYPTPNASGQGIWAEPVRKAREYIQSFNLTQRVQLVTGVGWQQGPCVGNIAAIPEVGFPGLCLQDSPLGVRFADNVNVWPTGLTTAATFSSDLAYQRGKGMGREHKTKGVNIQLGPGMNHHAFAAGGRNWEMGGADPYLSGESAYHTIKGMQESGVQACAKHYIGNDQEHFRNEGSVNIEARAMREIYLHPFMRSVQADAATLMASYNLLNNSWSAQNSYQLNEVLYTELGFQGAVISDWGAQHSGVASANAGLSMTMPGDELCCFTGQNSSFWGRNLTEAVNNGTVAASQLENMGVRILAAWFLLGQDDPDYPKPNFDSFDLSTPINKHVNVNKLYNTQELRRHIASAGTVLVKNEKKKNGYRALPLKKPNGHTPNHLAVLGSDAGPAFLGANGIADRGGVDGTLGIGWGSGSADYSYLISPYEALQGRAVFDGTAFSWSFDDYNLKQAKKISDERIGIDAAVVFLQSDSGEGYITVDGNAGDRNNLTAWHAGDELVKAVASVQSNTIVVMHSPGQMDVEAWIENPNVTAVIFAHMPGAESGNSIRDVLYGDYVPSGRLPYTVAKNRTDYESEVTYVNRSAPGVAPQLNYTDGLLVDYRHFDAKNITPRFEFGFGLSYTSFEIGEAHGEWINGDHNSKRNNDGHGKEHGKSHGHPGKSYDDQVGHDDGNSPPNTIPTQSPFVGTKVLPASLFKDVYKLTFSIRNTGDYDGHEVPQAYLRFPASAGEPPKVLRKFDRVFVPKGETKEVTWIFNAYDFSHYSAKQHKWIRSEGEYEILIGKSSRKIKRKVKVEGVKQKTT